MYFSCFKSSQSLHNSGLSDFIYLKNGDAIMSMGGGGGKKSGNSAKTGGKLKLTPSTNNRKASIKVGGQKSTSKVPF